MKNTKVINGLSIHSKDFGVLLKHTSIVILSLSHTYIHFWEANQYGYICILKCDLAVDIDI